MGAISTGRFRVAGLPEDRRQNNHVELPRLQLVDARTRSEIPLPNLAPSSYVLRIQANAADPHAEQLVAFSVGP